MSSPDPTFEPPAVIKSRDAVIPYVEPETFARHLDQGEELNLDFRQLIMILMRRWRPATAVALVAAVVTGAVIMTRHPIYTATATTVLEASRPVVSFTPNQDQTPILDTTIIDTRVMTANSLALAERVVKSAGLLKDPEFAGVQEPGEPAPTVSAVAAALRNHIVVRRLGITSAIQISVKSRSAAKAAKIANVVADEFVNSEVDRKSNANQQSNQFINDHLRTLQAQAEVAETAVQQYKIAHNLMSSAGQTLAEQQVGTLSQQIAVAEADLAERQARLNAANEQQSKGGVNQDISATLTSNTISQLRTQEAEASRRLADLKSHYGPRYPDVQKAESQLAEISSKIQDEANRIHSSLSADVNAAAQRLRSLRSSQYSAQGSLASNSRAEVGLIELERKAEASRQLYDAFLNRSKETSVAGAEQPDAHVVDRATEPLRPSFPQPSLALMLAGLAALLGAVGTIAILEALDTSIRSSEDVVKRFGLPVIGVIPTPRSSEHRDSSLRKLSPPAYLLKRPFSVLAEAFRKIRVTLLIPDSLGRRARVFAIASSLPSEGKSTTAFCLLRSLALSGTSSVLVDCDLGRRGVSSLVGKMEKGGLVEVIRGEIALADALVYDAESSGWILPVIGPKEDQVDFFSSTEMDELIQELRERFDVVLLDTPATLALADASAIVSKADAVLFVIQWAKTPAKAVALGLETLVSARANIFGVIISIVDMKKQARTTFQDAASYYNRYADYYRN